MIEITIDKTSDKPLYAQIRDALQTAIREGTLQPGEKIPPVTMLAKEIGVTHATIRRALEDLSKSGAILSHVGRGTFVTAPAHLAAQDIGAETSSRGTLDAETVDPEAVIAARRVRMGMTKSLHDLMALAKRPGLIEFTSGIPDPEIFREGLLQELTQDALQQEQRIYLGYGDSMGMLALREEIARRWCQKGIQVTPDQVLITSGSQQAIALLAQAALENKQRVICETPSYMGLMNVFGAFGHWIETVVRDAAGPLPDRLNRFSDGKPALFYFCPKLHNPMGTDTTPERRKIVIDWAKERDVLLISDEIFQDLHFEDVFSPSLLSEAGEQHTVVVSSLSKSVMCGLRVGWLISSAERVRSLLALKRAIDIACPPLMQGIALSLFRTGTYDAHVHKAREHYRERRDTVLKALRRFMPDGVTWTKPQGGFHLWVELPAGYSSITLFLLAIERGVAILPGPLQDINHRFLNAFRLSYGSVNPDQIFEGVEILADAVRELFKSSPGGSGLSGAGDFQHILSV